MGRDDSDERHDRHQRRQHAAAFDLAVIVGVDRHHGDALAQFAERAEEHEIRRHHALGLGIEQARLCERRGQAEGLRTLVLGAQPAQQAAILGLVARDAGEREYFDVGEPASDLAESLLEVGAHLEHRGIAHRKEIELAGAVEVGDVAALLVTDAGAQELRDQSLAAVDGLERLEPCQGLGAVGLVILAMGAGDETLGTPGDNRVGGVDHGTARRVAVCVVVAQD